MAKTTFRASAAVPGANSGPAEVKPAKRPAEGRPVVTARAPILDIELYRDRSGYLAAHITMDGQELTSTEIMDFVHQNKGKYRVVVWQRVGVELALPGWENRGDAHRGYAILYVLLHAKTVEVIRYGGV